MRSKKLDLARCGALIGSAMGGMHSFAGAVEAMTFQSFKKMNPFCIPFAITNMGGALAAMDIGFMARPPALQRAAAAHAGLMCASR